jgi:hypothetical protein
MNNRHQRRRAAAVARRLASHGTAQAPRRGYVGRLLTAIDRGGLARGVHSVSCVHSASCGMRSGAQCDCTPEISVSGPDGVTEIDEAGNPRRHTRQ